ncbi:MAG: TetR/AcrR family transcriptional regulator; helix-turn-helix transcriptional regulator, partial [Clostridia bacterium]|nr:TetR/AcrR family transcriptional regulator; helix-turn-helix transcriptional regulator [Clostridia bacterium]
GLDLFIRKGYSATRTADIAQAVGMSEGLLFHYFETKEKLYVALLQIAASGKDNVFGLTDCSPVGFFETTARTIIDYISKEPFAAKLFVLMNRAQHEAALPEDIRNYSMRQKDIEFSVNLIVQGQKDGSIRAGNPIALAITFFMAIQGVAENIARHPEAPVPNPEWIVDIIRSK